MSKVPLSQIPEQKVVATVNQLGLSDAAKSLGTSSATLCRWLKDKSFIRKSQYVKAVATPQTT